MSQLDAHQQELDDLRTQVSHARSAGRNDVAVHKARSLSALRTTVLLLEQAHEAAHVDPVPMEVVRRMLSDALYSVNHEIDLLSRKDNP